MRCEVRVGLRYGVSGCVCKQLTCDICMIPPAVAFATALDAILLSVQIIAVDLVFVDVDKQVGM